MKQFTKKDFAIFGGCLIVALVAIIYNQNLQSQNSIYLVHPLSQAEIQKYYNTDLHAVVIYPILTQRAYEKNGFYDYYSGKCDTCNSIQIDTNVNASYNIGKNSFDVLRSLGYPYVTDLQVDQDPKILDNYDKVILLHNEYVTQNEFNAITHHKNVIYLYPNSLYGQVSISGDTMTLIRGHGIPDKNTLNGFNYSTSSNNEYDLNCRNYYWEAMPNGIQISCWPEFLIDSDRILLQTIKDYPTISPVQFTNITKSSINIPYCDNSGKCQDNMPPGYYRIPLITKPSFVELNQFQTRLMLDALSKYSTLDESAKVLNEDRQSLILNLWHSTSYDFNSKCQTLSTDGSLSLLLECKIKDSSFLFKPYPTPTFIFLDNNFLKTNCQSLDDNYKCLVNSTKISLSKASL